MKDLKSSLGVEISSIKTISETNSNLVANVSVALVSTNEKVSTLSSKSMVSERQLSQHFQCINEIDDKVVTLEDKSDVLENELQKLKCVTEQTNLSLNDMVSNVEHELVSHLETIKLNVEKEIFDSKQNQIHVENRLSDFTKEIDYQTVEINSKIQELKSDFENLKTLSENTNSVLNPSPINQTSNQDSPSKASGSCSKFPHRTPQQENEQNPLYMYGDTSRTLILDGINETPKDNLFEISIRCMNDIGIPLNWDDIEDVRRIGKPDKNRKWPRPVKLTLKDPSIRDQIFFFKSRFSLSNLFKSVRVHKEERKDCRIKAAKLRQAGLTALNLGHIVESGQTSSQ